MVLSAGDRVDRYVIEGLLGTGGMGNVFRARDVRLQRSVALKILKSERDAGSTPTPESPGATRMLREARAGAALRHANVVTVYDVGEIEQPESLRGTTFLAMELIAGKPLRQYVGDSSIPLEQRLRWLESIARALSAAHAVGLVHRDVKPENVMIDEDGTAKVLDFGVAKHTGLAIDPASTTESLRAASVATWGSAVGTPAYMSPEQMRNEPLDGRADQFAWGVTAYELLCGERPWVSTGSVLQLVSDILSVAPVPLSQRCPGVPAAVAAVIDRALAKGRQERFGSMDDLLAALRDPALAAATTLPDVELAGALSPVASTPRPIPPRVTEGGPRLPGRRSGMLVAVLAVSVAAAAVLVVVWVASAGRGLATPAVAHENLQTVPSPATVASSQPAPLEPSAASGALGTDVPPRSGPAATTSGPVVAGVPSPVARAAGTAREPRPATTGTAAAVGSAASPSSTVTPLTRPPPPPDDPLDRRL